MPKYHFDLDQNSEAWELLRLGIPTASEFHRIITPEGKASAQAEDYADRLIAEKILKRNVDFSMADSGWMQRGKELEQEAVCDYELMNDIETKPVGFVTTDDGLMGCSPDRLVGDDGLLELKCPAPQTLIGVLIASRKNTIEPRRSELKAIRKYYPQIQGQLYVTGRKWCDLSIYHPDLFRFHIRVYRDEVYLKIMEKLMNDFNEYIADSIINIIAPEMTALSERRSATELPSLY